MAGAKGGRSFEAKPYYREENTAIGVLGIPAFETLEIVEDDEGVEVPVRTAVDRSAVVEPAKGEAKGEAKDEAKK